MHYILNIVHISGLGWIEGLPLISPGDVLLKVKNQVINKNLKMSTNKEY